MMNTYYNYPHKELWDGTLWKDRISYIDGLAQWLGENVPMNEEPYAHREVAEPKLDPDYRLKTGSLDDHEVIGYWASKGIRMTVLGQGGKLWVAMVPEKAIADREHTKLPALVVFHKEQYSDPWWAMRTVAHYKEYNENLARTQDHMIVYLVEEGPDVDRIYLNILQEAFILFPTDLNKIYIDVSQVKKQGASLADMPKFFYFDEAGNPANPDAFIEQFGALEVAAINVGGRWGNRDSLARGLVMEYAMNDGIFDREWYLNSATGKKMAEGLEMEYRFSSVYDPGFAEYWENRGLKFEVHHYHGERWMAMVPISALEHPEKKLPVLLALQEVYPGNEHLAVASMSYFFEAMDIAAQGECIVLFFVLEDPDSNELALDIVAEAEKLYPIDPQRLYVTGHSHDGGFARIFAYRHPEKVAAVAVMGNGVVLASSSETGNPVGGTEDWMLEELSKVKLPIINLGGEREHHTPDFHTSQFPVFAKGWQRRLAVCRCAPKTVEQIAAAQHSSNIVERKMGVPFDETQVLWMDGFEHYIGDLVNQEGKHWTRMVCIDNSPHTVTASMLTLAWSFLRRFARDLETGEVIERY